MRLEAGRESMVCDFCGSVYFPSPNRDGVRVLDEPSPLTCPACAVPLVTAAVAGCGVDYCSRCRGMLVPMDAFLAIVTELRSRREGPAEVALQTDWKGLERHIRCPQCDREMDTHAYGGGGNIIIDSCSACELDWLDGGELDRVVRARDGELVAGRSSET